jgi:hypothetical protein
VLGAKLRQSAKLREIAAALEADGFIGLDAQATALGLSRSTAWTILNGSHKSSGLSAKTLNRMLAAPLLGERARTKNPRIHRGKASGPLWHQQIMSSQIRTTLGSLPTSTARASSDQLC